MTSAVSPPPNGVLSVLADAVKQSVETTFNQIFSEKPSYQTNGLPFDQSPCVAGIISFMGDAAWSLTCILSAEAAPALALKFTGMDIPFDSPDMGDVAGELVNVLAGEVVAQLERRRLRVQMSLPTVARGSPLEFLPERRLVASLLAFRSSYGNFWLRVATPVPAA